MARTITDEEIKLSIIINGNPAQKQLLELEKATRKLTEENKGLMLERKRLEAQGQKDSEQYKKLSDTIKANSLAIAENKSAMKDLQNQIGLTGLTMKQLTDKAHLLRMTLRNLIPGSVDYRRYQDELSEVTTRINELNGRSTQAGFSIGSLADRFNRYAALGASVIGVFAGMVVSVQKIIDLNGKLSDAQANVMKTTGMTKDEVDELTKSFGALKTRTGRIELLGIAESGGRLGIAKNEIQDFVKVMDKAGVALGDSFEGGAEVVSDKLGKIKGLYDDLSNATVETAFESVGSALNDLGASGAASEENISEFVTRVGAMPEAFKPSIGTALGLGAAFEESGLKAEVAAGNYSKVISIAANNAAGFAQVMGKSKKEVEDLLKTNPNEFFLQFAESLKGMNAIDLAKTLDALKLNDNEVKMVLGAASKNTDLFREKIDLANKSLIDATSLTKEFDIKNNNLAATLEKIKKSVSGWFSSEGFVEFLISAVNGFAKFIGAAEDTEGTISAFKNTLVFTAKIIAIVTAAFVTNVAWQKMVVAWTNRNTAGTILYGHAQKARAVADAIALIATQAFAAGQMLLTGNITGATQALRIMNTVFKTTPWGFILGAVAAIGAAYVMFSEETKQAATRQSILNETMQEADGIVKKQTSNLFALLKVAQDETASKEARRDAIAEINKISPEYLGNLTLENIRTMAAKNAIDLYVKSLQRKQQLKALERRADALNDKIIEKKAEPLSEETNFLDTWWSNIDAADASLENTAQQRRKKAIAEIQKELNLTNAAMAELMKKNPDLIKDFSGGNDVIPGAPTSKPTKEPKKKEKYDDSYIADEKKYYDELLKMQKQNEIDGLELMKDGVNKEIAQQKIKHAQKIDELTRQNIEYNKISDVLDKKIIDAEKSGDIRKVESLKKQQNYVAGLIVSNNDIIEHEEKLHNQKLTILAEKAGLEEIKKLKDNYEQEKLVRETVFLNELERLNLTEGEKNKRKKQFEEAENKRLEESYNNQILLLENMINDVDFAGIDFSLLTPDQEEELKGQIEKLQNALAKIKEAKDGIIGNTEKEISLGLGTQSDILGFSQEQWNNFYKNIDSGKIGIETMAFAVFALKNAFVEVDKLVSQSEAVKLKQYEKNADVRKKSLKRQLDAGVIDQDQYNKRVEKIDEDLDNKKFAIELKQAKRQKLIGAMNVLQSTAQAIMGIWAQVPKFDFGVSAGLLTGIVGGIGAIQLASVLKAPLPTRGAEEGYYPNLVRREQDNKLFRTTGTSKMKSGLFTKPRLLVGEGPGDMPEMVIDKKAFAQISPETKSALLREISTVKGFENGYYNKGSFYTGTQNNNPQNSNDDVVNLLKMALTVVAKNTEVMNDIKENGLLAFVSNKDFQSMKNLKKGIKEYDQLISKSKVS